MYRFCLVCVSLRLYAYPYRSPRRRTVQSSLELILVFSRNGEKETTTSRWTETTTMVLWNDYKHSTTITHVEPTCHTGSYKCYLPPDRCDIPSLPQPIKAGTRFTTHDGCKARKKHTESYLMQMVCRTKRCHQNPVSCLRDQMWLCAMRDFF